MAGALQVGAAAAEAAHARQQRQPERDIADRSGTSAADSLAPLPARAAVTAAPAPADTLPAITEQGDQAASWDFRFPEAECAFPPQHSTSAEQTPGQLQRPLADFDCAFSTDMGAAASRQLPEAGPPASGSAVAGGSSRSRGNPLPNQFTTVRVTYTIFVYSVSSPSEIVLSELLYPELLTAQRPECLHTGFA